MKFRQQLIFENVVAGKKAYCNVPLGKRIHMMVLEIGSANNDDFRNIVDDILIKVNDNYQRTANADQLDQLNRANGERYATRIITPPGAGNQLAHLPIYFFKPWAKLARDQEGSAWTTDWMSRFRLEILLKAGITTPTLGGWMVFDDVTSNGKGQFIEKWIRNDIPAVGKASESDNYLPKKDILTQLSLWDPAPAGTTISRVKFKVGTNELYDLLRNQIGSDSAQYAEMTPNVPADPTVQGRLDCTFDSDGLLTSGLPVANYPNLRLRLEYNQAANGTVTSIAQQFGLPE
jgi:hypothetical protein